MKREMRKKIVTAVDEKNDDYDDLVMDLYAAVIVGNDDDVDIEVMNLIVSLVVKKIEGFGIRSG